MDGQVMKKKEIKVPDNLHPIPNANLFNKYRFQGFHPEMKSDGGTL